LAHPTAAGATYVPDGTSRIRHYACDSGISEWSRARSLCERSRSRCRCARMRWSN